MTTVPSLATVTVGQLLTAAGWNDDVVDEAQYNYGQGSNPRPECQVYSAANISVTTSGTARLMTFDTDQYDTAAMHNPSSNPSRITMPVDGLYEVKAYVKFAADATGYRLLSVRLNSAGAIGSGTGLVTHGVGNAGATVDASISRSFTDIFTAGDYIEIFATQASGGALNALGGRHNLGCTVRWISA